MTLSPEHKCYIVHHSYRHFVNYIEDKAKKDALRIFKTSRGIALGSTEYIYISEPERLRGLHGVEIEIIGFPNDKDIDKWRDNIAVARIK